MSTPALGSLVYVWRKVSPDRYQLVPALVVKRHRDGTVTVNFQTPNGRWHTRCGEGMAALDGARISNSGVHQTVKSGEASVPVEYVRVDV